MKTVLRIFAVLFVVIGVFLVVVTIQAFNSAGGARTGVAVAYIAGAIVLVALATWMWRRPVRT
jgi:hypothetical protein